MGKSLVNGILFSLILGTVACERDGRGSPGDRSDARGEVVALRGRILMDTLALSLPRAVLEMDGHFVVQDMAADRAVQVFDSAGHLVASAGREGSGPGEFTDPFDMFMRPGHSDEFWVFDSRLGRLTPYDIAAFTPGTRPQPSGEPVTLSPPFVFETPRWLDDTTLVALHPMMASGDGRFALFGPDGVRRRSVGAPPPGSDRIRPFIRQQAYGGHMAVHPHRALFVLASRYAGHLDVFDRAGNRLARAQVPEAFDPDYSPGRDGLNMVRGPGFRFGYVDVAATEDHIFALFSGRRFQQGYDGSEFGDQVHVFDWEGRHLGGMKLDAAALRISVNLTGTRLYAIRHDPQPQVVAYDLSGLAIRRTARR